MQFGRTDRRFARRGEAVDEPVPHESRDGDHAREAACQALAFGRGLEMAHALRVVVQEQADRDAGQPLREVERDLGPIVNFDQRRANPLQQARNTGRVANIGIGRQPSHGLGLQKRHVREQGSGLRAADDDRCEGWRPAIHHRRQAPGDEANGARPARTEAFARRKDDCDGSCRHGRGP